MSSDTLDIVGVVILLIVAVVYWWGLCGLHSELKRLTHEAQREEDDEQR